MMLLAQTIPMPTEGQDAALWLLGVTVVFGGPAVALLLKMLLTSKDERTADWRLIGTTATTDLSKTIDSLATVSNAIERQGRDQTAAIERHGQDQTAAIERYGQAVVAVGQDVRKLSETVSAFDRRLERLEEPPRGRKPESRES